MPFSAEGMRTDPPVSVPRPAGTIPAAMAAAVPPGGAAGELGRVPGIADRAEGGVVGCDAEGQFMHVGLAEQDRPGVAQPGQNRCVSFRHPVLQRRRSRTGGDAGRGEIVFYRDGDPVERAVFAGLVGLCGSGACAFGVDGE